MKIIHIIGGWYDIFTPFKDKEQVHGVDLLIIDGQRYNYDPKNPKPHDSEHFLSYNKEDLKMSHRGIGSVGRFDDYLLLESKIIERIEDNEDIILFSNCRSEDNINFFDYLCGKKHFRLHIVKMINSKYISPDYHEHLRLLDCDNCLSVCYLNCAEYSPRFEGDYRAHEEPFFAELEHIINAVRQIDGDSFCIYNSEKKAYVPFERPPVVGESLFEYITPVKDIDICQQLYECRRDFAKKYNKDFDEKPCIECEFHDECGHICPECDSEATSLWNSVYIYPYDDYDEDEPDKPVIPYPYKYENAEGKINGIDRMRIDIDGKGVRTLVLMAGCPLNCKYCGNRQYKDIFPETNTKNVDNMKWYLHKDGVYFEMTNGGITFGGGEPLMQPDFIHNFCRNYAMWSVNIETSLNCPWEYVEKIAEDIDEWYIDIKDMNSEIYRAYTGSDNMAVIENLQRLIRLVPPERICIRVPLIKGFNGESDVEDSVRRLRKLGFVRFDRFEYKA